MSIETAHAVWGAAAVEKAMAEPNPEPSTPELVDEVRRRESLPGALAEWALAQPWPRFCAIVRIVAGEELQEVMGHGDA